MVELYRDFGLRIYERVHYSRGQHIQEVEQILKWYSRPEARVLDIGCSGGLHALEFARRGYSVAGVDIEPSAIELAKKRCGDEFFKAEFRVIDIAKDDISSLGKFDLIYSLGNVLSHVRKEHIADVLKKIRGCLNEIGLFLFDILIIGEPFQEEVLENDVNIIWNRRLNNISGKICMKGIFSDFGIIQNFEVWGYEIAEILGLLYNSGFKNVEFSDRLDFSSSGSNTRNPVCLRVRARV